MRCIFSIRVESRKSKYFKYLKETEIWFFSLKQFVMFLKSGGVPSNVAHTKPKTDYRGKKQKKSKKKKHIRNPNGNLTHNRRQQKKRKKKNVWIKNKGRKKISLKGTITIAGIFNNGETNGGKKEKIGKSMKMTELTRQRFTHNKQLRECENFGNFWLWKNVIQFQISVSANSLSSTESMLMMKTCDHVLTNFFNCEQTFYRKTRKHLKQFHLHVK